MLSWRVNRTAKDLDLYIYDGKDGRTYDFLNIRYKVDDWRNYENLGTGLIRSSGTMLAKQLKDHAFNISYQGKSIIAELNTTLFN